ncbi:hypothetical protein REPUB_Repub15cG0092800 [Reevesia pubescens]
MGPFCLFLLMDIYWKYENRPHCEADSCTPSEHLRHQKSIMKSQRNALLIAAALIFYWILYSVTNLVVKLEQLNEKANEDAGSTGMRTVALLGAGISGFLGCATIASADEAEHGLEVPNYPWPHEGILSSYDHAS